jgi:hypothetical protein
MTLEFVGSAAAFAAHNELVFHGLHGREIGSRPVKQWD